MKIFCWIILLVVSIVFSAKPEQKFHLDLGLGVQDWTGLSPELDNEQVDGIALSLSFKYESPEKFIYGLSLIGSSEFCLFGCGYEPPNSIQTFFAEVGYIAKWKIFEIDFGPTVGLAFKKGPGKTVLYEPPDQECFFICLGGEEPIYETEKGVYLLSGFYYNPVIRIWYITLGFKQHLYFDQGFFNKTGFLQLGIRIPFD